MEDQQTPEQPKKDLNKLDLSQLEGFSFGTEWTKDVPPSDTGPNRRRENRPRRDDGRDDRRDRRGFKRSSGPVSDGGGPGGQRDRRSGGDRRSGADRRSRGTDGGRRQGERRGQHAPGQQTPYISPHFDVTFYPEDISFSTLAKTIRASARTFELFDIAKTVIGKNDRFVVVVERKKAAPSEPDAEKKPFYVCLLDGMPFETEDALINHVVQNHLERFFKVSEVETEAPKGSFQVINRCGVTGELLGPPNYHRYNQIVQQHHATRLSRMDFDRFNSRIETVRDEEVVQQWLDSMKTVARYTWLGDDNVPTAPDATTGTPAKEASAESPATDAAPSAEVSPPAAEATPAEAVDATEVATETQEEAPSAEISAETEVEPVPDAGDPAANAEAETMAVKPEAEESKPAESSAPEPTFDSPTDAKIHLIAHARDKVLRSYEHSRFHGRILDDMPDSEIKRAVMGALERQRRFPLDTANALRGRLRREGFTIFKKGSKGISYVSAVKRKFRVAGQTFADSINELIDFIEHHPMVKVSELPEKFLGVSVPESAESKQEAATATAPGTVSPFGEADQPRIKRMQVDLRWLVTEGYVTEFIDGSLFAAPPMPAPKPKAETAAPAPATATPAAAESTSETSPPVEASTETGPPANSAPAETTPTAEATPTSRDDAAARSTAVEPPVETTSPTAVPEPKVPAPVVESTQAEAAPAGEEAAERKSAVEPESPATEPEKTNPTDPEKPTS